jgi:hypothetical protein
MMIQRQARELEDEKRKSIPFPAEFDISGLMHQPLMFREERGKELMEELYNRQNSEDIAVNSVALYDTGEPSCEKVHQLLTKPIPEEEISAMKSVGYRILEFGAFSFADVLQALRVFYRINGHLDVPLDYVVDVGKFEDTYSPQPSSKKVITSPVFSENPDVANYLTSNEQLLYDLRAAAAYSLNEKYTNWVHSEQRKRQKNIGLANACAVYGPFGGLTRHGAWRNDERLSSQLHSLNLTETPTVTWESIVDISSAVAQLYGDRNRRKALRELKSSGSSRLFSVLNISEFPIYAECLHGLRLGHAVASLRAGDIDGFEDPDRRAVLDSIGFNWGDLSKHLRFRFIPMIIGLQIYRRFNGHTIVPCDFTVPDAPHWPYWMYKAPLGLWCNIARIQQNDIEAFYPQRKEMLDDMKFLWWLPPEENVPRKYYESLSI